MTTMKYVGLLLKGIVLAPVALVVEAYDKWTAPKPSRGKP